MNNLKQYYEIVNKTRDTIIKCNIKPFAEGTMLNGTGKRNLRPEIGDLVLVKDTDSARAGTYGRIDKIET